jgi:hypothetical protein
VYSITSTERDHFINAYSLDIRRSRTWEELTKSSKEAWQEIAAPLNEFFKTGVDEAEQRGVQKVVEWVNKQKVFGDGNREGNGYIEREEWQAFLKGIEK